jgi:hypothetical protein
LFDEQDDEGEAELNYAEFLDAIVAIAALVVPNPYDKLSGVF